MQILPFAKLQKYISGLHFQYYWMHIVIAQNAQCFQFQYVPWRQWDQCICFLSSLPHSPPSHYGSIWVLPVISLLLTNSVLPVRACLIMLQQRFRGTQKVDDRGPLGIQSSLHGVFLTGTDTRKQREGSSIQSTIVSVPSSELAPSTPFPQASVCSS